MADLQDHVDTATAIGQLDAEYAQISAPARPSPVLHPDAPAPPDPLARARALLAAHPVVDGFNGHALADSLGTLRAYHALGVRSITFTGTSWTGRGGGLTRFGQEVVREMNRLGILVDLTGASPDTMRRALAVAKAPVIFSHSAAHALTDHPSNVPDDVLRMLRSNNGLCMVGFAADQVAREGTASLREVADHLEHVREVAGPDCVGLGAGYDTGATHADGLTDVSRYPQLIAELLERDWSESDVAALTWGNAARVMREAEFASRAAQLRRAPSTATIGELDR
ncbi:membrane dipeptidase [Streptomyces sp. NPDC057582]|uniref:membrane dipeptidase n=1 Tax=Streptomyces sp. NPDC057582 TaxID=3346174 RepID=UPI0036B55CC9